MNEFRQNILIMLFCIGCLVIFGLSASGFFDAERSSAYYNKSETVKREMKHYFNDVIYFIIDHTRSFLHLNADLLTIDNSSSETYFLHPEGNFYTKKKEPIKYRAIKGFYYRDDNLLILRDEVLLKSDTSQLKSNHLLYEIATDKMISSGEVKTKTYSKKTKDKLLIDADKVVSWPKSKKANYYGNVRGHIKRKRVYEENIYFKSDELKLDPKVNKIYLTGSVDIKKQEINAKAMRGEILLENYNKQLKYYALYDDVKVVERIEMENGKYVNRRAYAEKLEGIISEDKIILTGYPKVFQNDDIIKGNKIILRENNEVIEVDDATTNFFIK